MCGSTTAKVLPLYLRLFQSARQKRRCHSLCQLKHNDLKAAIPSATKERLQNRFDCRRRAISSAGDLYHLPLHAVLCSILLGISQDIGHKLPLFCASTMLMRFKDSRIDNYLPKRLRVGFNAFKYPFPYSCVSPS